MSSVDGSKAPPREQRSVDRASRRVEDGSRARRSHDRLNALRQVEEATGRWRLSTPLRPPAALDRLGARGLRALARARGVSNNVAPKDLAGAVRSRSDGSTPGAARAVWELSEELALLRVRDRCAAGRAATRDRVAAAAAADAALEAAARAAIAVAMAPPRPPRRSRGSRGVSRPRARSRDVERPKAAAREERPRSAAARPERDDDARPRTAGDRPERSRAAADAWTTALGGVAAERSAETPEASSRPATPESFGPESVDAASAETDVVATAARLEELKQNDVAADCAARAFLNGFGREAVARREATLALDARVAAARDALTAADVCVRAVAADRDRIRDIHEASEARYVRRADLPNERVAATPRPPRGCSPRRYDEVSATKSVRADCSLSARERDEVRFG